MLKLIKTSYSILLNELRTNNPLVNTRICSNLVEKFNSSKIETNFKLDVIINNLKIGILKTKKNWFFNDKSKEWNLVYENSFFGQGTIRIYLPKEYKKVLIFLPGTLTSSNDVLSNPNNRFYLRKICADNDIALVCWDWPLNGSRIKNGLIKNVSRYTSLEREYEKIFSLFSSSLWIEYINEIMFIFKMLNLKLNQNDKISLCGWSMGGFFFLLCSTLWVKNRKSCLSRIMCIN